SLVHMLADICVLERKNSVYDMLKIQSFQKNGDRLEVSLQNVDDDFFQIMTFENFKHFKNTFEKYGE
ncbi:hypothetical protein CFT12S02847_09070, partial [Campylobacter fetus subsp. testudinum]|uniref:hypothetical protein n=1 Tax=Campylobacter fetus TaxID=196 RepID=UPI00082866F2